MSSDSNSELDALDPRGIDVQSAVEIAAIVWPQFTVVEDLVFFASEAPDAPGVENWESLTSLEASTNHVHVLDLFAHRAGLSEEPFWDDQHPDFVAATRFGKAWAHAVATKLWLEFPERNFMVYYTERDNPIVRFHQVHPGELTWLDPEDWREALSTEEIIIYEVRGRHSVRDTDPALPHGPQRLHPAKRHDGSAPS